MLELYIVACCVTKLAQDLLGARFGEGAAGGLRRLVMLLRMAVSWRLGNK